MSQATSSESPASNISVFYVSSYRLRVTFPTFVVAPAIVKLLIDRGGENPHPYTHRVLSGQPIYVKLAVTVTF